jgi:hypothetical protein
MIFFIMKSAQKALYEKKYAISPLKVITGRTKK